MVSLVFHGGHYKTGTTSLQHTLRHCEPALAAAGILSKRAGRTASSATCSMPTWWPTALPAGMIGSRRIWPGSSRRRRAKNCKTILLSSELATSFHQFPDGFARWAEATQRLFDDVRYVFVVRDAVGYATSMYRELVKSGRASFHYDAVKDELLKQLCLQQRSIAFFRKWDRKRVKHLSYRTLAADSLVRDLVKALVKFKIDPASRRLSHIPSEKKAQNIPALLLNDVYALLGAQTGQDALANEVRAMVKAGVKRGKLRRAFDDEFAARIEQAFLDVTASHVRRVFESEQPAFQRSLSRVPKKDPRMAERGGCDQRSRSRRRDVNARKFYAQEARSISMTASALLRPSSTTLISSSLKSPQEAMTAACSAPSRTGYSKLAPAKIACASGEIMNSRNLIALSLLGEYFATPAPDTLTCVPRVPWLGKKTLHWASFCFSASSSPESMRAK